MSRPRKKRKNASTVTATPAPTEPADLTTVLPEPCPSTSGESVQLKVPVSDLGQSVQLEVSVSDLDKLWTPPSNSLIESAGTSAASGVDTYSASASSSNTLRVDTNSATSTADTPLTTAKSTKGCTHKARCHNLLRVNKRLEEKVSSLKEEVSNLKDAIKELECVSVVEQHL